MVREFERAEQQPPLGFKITTHSVGGVIRPSILVPVPSRAIWSLPLPRRGRFRAFLALSTSANSAAVRFRFGVSDLRIYEGLAQQTITADRYAWVDFGADVSAYAGVKFSLFYRPESKIWRVVLATDVVGASPATAVWGSPEILTDPPPRGSTRLAGNGCGNQLRPIVHPLALTNWLIGRHQDNDPGGTAREDARQHIALVDHGAHLDAENRYDTSHRCGDVNGLRLRAA